jgi:hypothetical protein
MEKIINFENMPKVGNWLNIFKDGFNNQPVDSLIVLEVGNLFSQLSIVAESQIVTREHQKKKDYSSL